MTLTEELQAAIEAATPRDELELLRGFLRTIARKRGQSNALHDYALSLCETPGRERDANTMSKEASRVDAELERLRASVAAIHCRLRFGGLVDMIAVHAMVKECEHAIPMLKATMGESC